MTHRAHMRALAGVAAIVLVACTLLAGLHRATVTHGVCAEHGEEIHLDRVSDHERAPDRDFDQIESATWELFEGDHHCALGATSRDPMTAGTPSDPAAAPDTSHDDTAPPGLPAAAAIALYRVAPKTSPPV